MARALSTVRLAVRDHLDEDSASYWTDASLTRQIVRSASALWKRIVQIRKDYFLSATPGTLTLASGTFRYALPSDFFEVKLIRTTTSGQENVAWRPAHMASAKFIEGLRSDITINSPSEFLYQIVANQTIVVSPIPRAVLVASVEYVALPTEPSADADTFGALDPFLDYVEYDAAAKLLAKGPVGDPAYWQNMADKEWIAILLALDKFRSRQDGDFVEGMFEGY